MPRHPFPDPGPDSEEPDRSPLPPVAEGDGPAGQGLYVCLPPEQLTLAGFAQNGEADTMAPGPLLGTVVHTVTGQDGMLIWRTPSGRAYVTIPAEYPA